MSLSYLFTDCGDTTCDNFGILDVKTCTCKCLPYYSGKSCEQGKSNNSKMFLEVLRLHNNIFFFIFSLIILQ